MRGRDAGGGATRWPGGCLAVSRGGCWLGHASSFWVSRRGGGSGAAVCPQPGQTSFLAMHSPVLPPSPAKEGWNLAGGVPASLRSHLYEAASAISAPDGRLQAAHMQDCL